MNKRDAIKVCNASPKPACVVLTDTFGGLFEATYIVTSMHDAWATKRKPIHVNKAVRQWMATFNASGRKSLPVTDLPS